MADQDRNAGDGSDRDGGTGRSGTGDAVEVTNDPDAGRYQARVDGRTAGFAAYEVRDGRVVFTHTEVDDAYDGQGVGSVLVREALDDVRAGARQVVPECSFVKAWIERHPDYQDLVAPQ